MRDRLPALDWMRGIVMVLMATDHASEAFNANRLVTDSVLFPQPKNGLDALEFVHRSLSHPCAPTFLFLAGAALALSIGRKTLRGDSPWTIDRDLLMRGLILIGLELFFINFFWMPGLLLLQVMYAIGGAMILMIPLRRLPTPILVAVGFGILAISELFLGSTILVPFELPAIVTTMFFGIGFIDTPVETVPFFVNIGLMDKVLIAYPVLPWLSMMAIGWGFGRYLARDTQTSPAKMLFACGVAALLLFALLRGFNTYGNMRLLRLDQSWIQWLHVSKYPPSLSYAALQLGLMALVLAGLFRLQNYRGDSINTHNPILVFGQTALFFYVVHIAVLDTAGRALGMYQQRGLLESTLATMVTLVVCYPICLWYRSYKANHRHNWTRYI